MALPGRLAGTLTDCWYLLMAALPGLRNPYRRWARRRYARLAPGYTEHVGTDAHYLLPLHRLLLTEPITPQVVIEIGAGTGAATRILRHAHPTAGIVAIDTSLAMLRRLDATAKGPLVRLAGDAFALPLRAATGDLIIAHNAPFDLQELVRVAKPAGTVAVILSRAQGVPAALRGWSLRRHRPAGWICTREHRAGAGLAWVFRRRDRSGPAG